MMIKPAFRMLFSLGFVFSVSSLVFADEKKPVGHEAQNRAEKEFAKRMENTVLVGFFTVDSDEPDRSGDPERYEIRKVTKAAGNTWIFQSRIKYGNVDAVLPIPVPIEWAGDTPVVSMTNFNIPTMGTFTCRVMFYKDRYAGTWQHGDKGGHMWGKIEKVQKPLKK